MRLMLSYQNATISTYYYGSEQYPATFKVDCWKCVTRIAHKITFSRVII